MNDSSTPSWNTASTMNLPSSIRRLHYLIGLVCLLSCANGSAQEWQTGTGFRFKELSVPEGGNPGFTRLAPGQTGLWFTNSLPESRSLTNTILPNGSGVASGDIDNDGWNDLFFSGLGGGSRLYRNLGSWRFEDVTARSGVALEELDATGAAFADIDGDGDLDLLVNTLGAGTIIFFNDGRGRFTRSSQALNLGRGGTSLALADADGDGDLDLYIANYRLSTLMDAPGTRFNIRTIGGQLTVGSIDGKPLTDPEWTNRFRFKIEVGPGGRGRFAHEELGEADLLCINDGKGNFTPLSWTSGRFLDERGQALIEPPFDWGLSVLFRDFNGDGHPDLYVCNDFETPDRFWINDGKGSFRAAAQTVLRQTSLASMGIDAADLDRDGHDDFMVVDMLSRKHQLRLTQRNMTRAELTRPDDGFARHQSPRNTLFFNRGDGTYAEIAHFAGLEASEWSWAPIFIDVDLDGFEDVLIPNGFERDNMNVDVQNRINQAKAAGKMRTREELMLRRMFPRLTTSNLAFRNLGGMRFEEMGRQWGFNSTTISQGACLVDLDNDGDLDVVLSNMNEAAGVYRNNNPAPRLAVRLKGLPPNTRGVGARIEIQGGPAFQSQQIIVGGRYNSSDDHARSFAAGTLTNELAISVSWRSGRKSEVIGARGNRIYEIAESHARPSKPAAAEQAQAKPPTCPLFSDVSHLLDHVHSRSTFDDFQRQPHLPFKLSQLGPGISWFDINGDGFDDLILGAGAGGTLKIMLNDGKGKFQQLTNSVLAQPLSRALTTILGWRDGAGVRLLAGASSYEDGLSSSASVRVFDPLGQVWTGLAPGFASSAGPTALADVDGDGDLDLFVGGRVIPGRYPEAASSRLFRNAGGNLHPDPENSAIFEGIGLVSGAVFTDLDADGFPELVLACEWGPLRVFRNREGRFSEATAELGFDKYPGLWNGINAGDFDGDGRLDLVASNWGQNTRHESFRAQPIRLYYGDFNRDGSVQMIESYWNAELKGYVPSRRLDDMARAMPFLRAKFQTLEAFSKATVAEVLAERFDSARVLQAHWFESTVFLNRGNHFEAVPLPLEAQLSPAFAVCVADLDGDGREDIFLSQNLMAVPDEVSPLNAGRALLLRGQGDGTFKSIPGPESGIMIYGEQRGAALADFDGDGRTDLAVTQIGAETKLFRNQAGIPGLRIRLKGPPGNPGGIGAVLRLGFGDILGAARELRAGSGYWSQDSAVQVMSSPIAPTSLHVRWPGGKSQVAEITPETLELEID
jgi:enediyne biosynthesis protein E4